MSADHTEAPVPNEESPEPLLESYSSIYDDSQVTMIPVEEIGLCSATFGENNIRRKYPVYIESDGWRLSDDVHRYIDLDSSKIAQCAEECLQADYQALVNDVREGRKCIVECGTARFEFIRNGCVSKSIIYAGSMTINVLYMFIVYHVLLLCVYLFGNCCSTKPVLLG